MIKKSLCTWRLYCNHQVHRDLLITLYNHSQRTGKRKIHSKDVKIRPEITLQFQISQNPRTMGHVSIQCNSPTLPPPNGATAPQWVKASSLSRRHDHRNTTLGRTSLDEWSARRRHLYLTKHTIFTRHRNPCPRQDSNPQSSLIKKS